MAIYLLTRPAAAFGGTLRNGVDQMVVAASSEASAKLAAAAKYGGDAGWANATAAALVDTVTVNSTGALVGYKFRVRVSDVGVAEVTGAATTLDVLDEIGAALATALNALTGIANAAYVSATQTLTVATGSGGDDLGDKKVTVEVFAPVDGAQGRDNLAAAFVSSVTDEGVATDALTVVFNADTTILPKVLAVGKQA